MERKIPKQSAMPFLGDSGASGDTPTAFGVSSSSLFQKCLDAWGTEAQVYQTPYKVEVLR